MTRLPPDAPRIVDPQVMREVLGHFASGVTVVTAVTDDGPIGFTCQSFSSLSLDPPLVAFAPARTSRTWPRLREIGRFCVNVLAEGQDDVSQNFARSGADKFAGVPLVAQRARRHRSSTTSSPGSTASCGPSTTAATTRIVVARVLDLGATPTAVRCCSTAARYGLLHRSEA